MVTQPTQDNDYLDLVLAIPYPGYYLTSWLLNPCSPFVTMHQLVPPAMFTYSCTCIFAFQYKFCSYPLLLHGSIIDAINMIGHWYINSVLQFNNFG